MDSHCKKVQKKIRRHQHAVTKQTGVTCTDTQTKNLALCNTGLVNGISEDIIVENFSKYGTINEIVLLPEKSCCFLSYKSVDSAAKAYNEANGILNIAQDNKPVYLSYVEELPKIEYKKTYNLLPPGLILLEDFISTEEEENILSSYGTFSDSSQNMKHRQVRHYGYEFLYSINNVKKDEPLEEPVPQDLDFLFTRLAEKCDQFESFQPDQLTINQYLPGQGIPHHVDTHSAFEDPIVSLSLGSSIVMEFKHEDGRHMCVLVPRRSLLVISGESRYSWTHGIVPKKYDVIYSENGYDLLERQTRVSFTFRKVRRGECHCSYKTKCDTYALQFSEKGIDDSLASKLEEMHVHSTYEQIADHFSNTRHTPWPNIVDFINSFEVGSILLDVGCGNGKYLGCGNSIYNVGCDRSPSLIDICRSRGYEAFICNSLSLPFKDNSVDGAISIAVIHHMATEERRLLAIKEICRILKIGGRALIYVWAKDQVKDNSKTSYIKQDRKNRRESQEIIKQENENVMIMNNVSLPVHTNRTGFKYQDLLVPWKLKGVKEGNQSKETYLRFYHVFEEGELDKLCKMIENIDVVKVYYDEGNWCAIIKKVR